MHFGIAQVCHITAFSHGLGPWVVVNEKDGYLDSFLLKSQGPLSLTSHFSQFAISNLQFFLCWDHQVCLWTTGNSAVWLGLYSNSTLYVSTKQALWLIHRFKFA